MLRYVRVKACGDLKVLIEMGCEVDYSIIRGGGIQR